MLGRKSFLFLTPKREGKFRLSQYLENVGAQYIGLKEMKVTNEWSWMLSGAGYCSFDLLYLIHPFSSDTSWYFAGIV